MVQIQKQKLEYVIVKNISIGGGVGECPLDTLINPSLPVSIVTNFKS